MAVCAELHWFTCSRKSRVTVASEPHAQQCLAFLRQYMTGGAKRKKFDDYIVRVRNNLTFHYDQSGKLIAREIGDPASRTESNATSITRGSSMHSWRWGIADDLIDTMVVRQIWRIPRAADLENEVTAIVNELHEIVLNFVDFCADVIWRYVNS